jgi:TonB family protein
VLLDRNVTSSWLAALAVTIALGLGAAGSQPPALSSFYIERSHFSDAFGAGGNYTEYLDVVPQGADVRVRLIHYSGDYIPCSGGAIEAVERIVPASTVRSLAGQDLCALTQKQIDAAARRARIGNLTIWESESDTIVATCSAREFVLSLPIRANVNSTMDRRDPAVASALRLFERVRDRVFAPDVPLTDAAGTALVPYLRSGRFAAVLSPQAFADYTGPQRNPLPAELLERDTLPLETYRPAPYPMLAASVRVAGDVRLRLRLSASGDVIDVRVVKSIPLLDQAAVDAARTWTFKPQPLAGNEVEVTLRFQKRCGS